MAGTKAPVVALVAVLFMVVSLAGVAQAHEGHDHASAPAIPPSTTSPAAFISSSFVSAFIVAAAALVFGSALMV
ncbi:hypothetical protein RchiOBHm_Chr6g0310461 [Rosa chinensis]|uniref:Arabinogalactan peptide, AGP n=1 Tax=Rosa chinensis TaxID=74649 RepID=A0A2P6Q1B5_ROSCH|nr:hypothetical protein RchiOBHm_Chr6g0310461 [Rosa chinensis]